MPKVKKQVDKDDPEYKEKRARNNEAIKKSREKARAKVRVLISCLMGIQLFYMKKWTTVFLCLMRLC